MDKTSNVKLQEGGLWKYQQQFGLNRKFPMNGVPAVRKRELTPAEKELLSAPLIKNARRDSKHEK
jgi:hypothetical protein